jgi:hypothetical protein
MSDVLERIRQLGLLDPTDAEVVQRRVLAPRLADLHGKVGGFLDNRKQNADLLLQRIAERLTAEYGLAGAVHQAKFIYSRVADPAIIDELSRRCDFVVVGIGD